MNIAFITLVPIRSFYESTIYTDLLRTFADHGDRIYVASPIERKEEKATYVIRQKQGEILRIKTGNLFQTNLVEKGISTLLLEGQFLQAIRKRWKDISFDLILYSTPPITFGKVIAYLKQGGARSYLLLKDIFPQNAVDLSMFGVHNPLYFYFRWKEKRLYQISDRIGCMSEANCAYIKRHNPKLSKTKIEVCPNTITPRLRKDWQEGEEKSILSFLISPEKFSLEDVFFLYGGNLGKPQGIPFLMKCLRQNRNRKGIHFVLCGTGTEYGRLERFLEKGHFQNVTLLSWLPKQKYQQLVAACDVGLIFLDAKFTIPNFPSRLLSYLEAEKPVLACTDRNTDIGTVIEQGGFGYWCESVEPEKFTRLVQTLASDQRLRVQMGKQGRTYLETHYTSEHAYRIIKKSWKRMG